MTGVAMTDVAAPAMRITREHALHALYEAAELEHNLMCTYLYAAFSLKDGEADGLSTEEAGAVKRWRGVLINVAVEEMGHLTAVWNITSALGGAPRVGRTNFPLDPGSLPAGIVVKLAPFNRATLQHFIFLERPHGSTERDGEGFAYERAYTRGSDVVRLVPMGSIYETVGEFYAALSIGLREIVARWGEDVAFDGAPSLQLSPHEIDLIGAKPVICLKTALAAFDAIVVQGEGAPSDSVGSHYQKFAAIREEYERLLEKNPSFTPAFPAATNPVLRRPPRPEGRVWLENPDAIAVVDLANAAYALMVRLLAYAYALHGPSPEKALTVDLAICLMRAVVPLAERAARLPAGPSNPGCHAGMSFTALHDSAALPPGRAARRFFVERFEQLAAVGESLRSRGDPRAIAAADLLASLAKRARRGFDLAKPAPTVKVAVAGQAVAGTDVAQAASLAQAIAVEKVASNGVGASTIVNGVETVWCFLLVLSFVFLRCIHARFCVTGAPRVFLANVQGPWVHPDAMDGDRLVEIARACPSGAIRYRREDGRAEIALDGNRGMTRCTLCRCGASKNKPFCDGSHHDVAFAASGEPATGKA